MTISHALFIFYLNIYVTVCKDKLGSFIKLLFGGICMWNHNRDIRFSTFFESERTIDRSATQIEIQRKQGLINRYMKCITFC